MTDAFESQYGDAAPSQASNGGSGSITTHQAPKSEGLWVAVGGLALLVLVLMAVVLWLALK